ncbi:hypothetical protein BGZ98_003242 [Dissophora globulifera]|nr:hypothetical protein BGZ98_003242 [Dissophora globulifera]
MRPYLDCAPGPFSAHARVRAIPPPSIALHPRVRARTSPPALLVFFILLSANCFLSSLPASTSSDLSFPRIQACDAAVRNSNTNQRVDAPSSEDFPPLTGPEFAYTNQTPLGNLTDARDYADGALATQKLVAASVIPVDRQLWLGVDTRTAYFGNDYSGGRIAKVPELLQAGMRRLVIDLWWDGTGLGWQLCPRVNRNGTQLRAVRLALEEDQRELQLQQMSDSSSGVALEGSSVEIGAALSSSTLQQDAQTQTMLPSPTLATSTLTTPSSTSTIRPVIRPTTAHPEQQSKPLEKRADSKSKESGLKRAHDNQARLRSKSSGGRNGNVSAASSASRRNKDTHSHSPHADKHHPQNNHQAAREGSGKMKTSPRPIIKPKGTAIDTAKIGIGDNRTAEAPSEDNRVEIHSSHGHRNQPNRLAMAKGVVSTYDKTSATDQTVDGITCSTGDDLVMLLQTLQNWIQLTSVGEPEDVLLLVLNLNEFGSNSSVSQSSTGPSTPTPTPTPTPSSPISGTNSTAAAFNVTALPPLSNEEFSKALTSPNTNQTIKALVPNILSLKELMVDAFPAMIYTPVQLEMDRSDLHSGWWKDGPVGYDYYNTTTDPMTGKIQAPTGWPTSSFIMEGLKRRLIIGFGANNLLPNTTYNITDDLTTLFGSGMLGPSMTNSSLLQISPAFTAEQCDFPVPGVMMALTGSESRSPVLSDMNVSDASLTEVSWSFSSMSDSDPSPWLYSRGQVASNCGFSALAKSRSPVLSFSELTAMAIWSWDLDQPPLNQTRSRDRRCGAMQSNGRWAVQDCNMKLPWIIYDKAANYRDVVCPSGYGFDVPRTARENQFLYTALLSYWNETSPQFYASIIAKKQEELHAAHLVHHKDPSRVLVDSTPTVLPIIAVRKRYEEGGHKGDDNEYEDDEDDEDSDSDSDNDYGNEIDDDDDDDDHGHDHGHGHDSSQAGHSRPSHPRKSRPGHGHGHGAGNGKLAGCWVPGGVEGTCPYQAPDNTVALQEIIKVSTIGGVIILVLVCMFLYLKCRRNVRLRKADKRRAKVRNKIMRTEVETVPA